MSESSKSVMQYKTSQGDRWDLIAYKFYGNPTMINELILANPHLPLAEQFEANLTVFIPVLPATRTIAQKDMPPWMR